MASTAPSPASRWRPAGGHRGRVAAGPARGPSALPPLARPSGADQPRASGRDARGLVLDVQDLRTYFFTYDGVVRALEGVNLQARAGETTGVVGETGCGKSVTAFSIGRLVSEPGRVISGKILLNGANLLWGLDREAKFRRVPGTNRVKVIRRFRQIRAGNDRMSAVRGRGVGMIFQEPTQAMNPVFSIADQLGEAVMQHRGIEVLDGLLRADQHLPRAERGLAREPKGAGAPAGGWYPPTGAEAEIEQLLEAHVQKDQDAMRAAAVGIARRVALPSARTQMFQYARHSPPGVARLRYQIQHGLARIRLNPLQRGYLRHLRRLELLNRRLKDVFLREMKEERYHRAARGRLGLQLRIERWTHFYYGLWGLRGRVRQPIKDELFWRSVELLEGVNIANPAQVARGYPHELSGGMLQRAMIAMALSCEPGLLLADEPTTALDVTIQAQILELMRQLRERVGTAIVLITHDLGVVAEVCDRVNVMYAGIVVESGPVREVFRRPLHPYTHGLLASIPRFDQPDRELHTIPGSVPNLVHPPPGCRFHPRCPYAMPICKEVRPEPLLQEGNHMVACHLYHEAEPPAADAPAADAAPPSEPLEDPEAA